MKSRSFIALFALAGLACGMLLVRAQEPDDEVRGAFLSSRPKTTNTNAPSHRHRPPRKANTNSSTTLTNANTGKNAVNANMKSSGRSEEHTSELQSLTNLVCRLLLEKKKNK